MLVRVAAQEENWHCTDKFATPEKLRLQQQLRILRLMCEMQEPMDRVSALSVLATKASKASAETTTA
eukprot:5500330-Pleurochrysis_carterae.AAC.2